MLKTKAKVKCAYCRGTGIAWSPGINDHRHTSDDEPEICTVCRGKKEVEVED